MASSSLKPRHILAGVVVLVALPLGFLLYSQSTALDSGDHERFASDVRQLQASEAILNQYLLRLRSGGLTSVDPLNAELSRIGTLERSLSIPPVFLGEEAQSQIRQRAEAHAERMTQKSELVERFKADNANLRTAVSYFPVVVGELIEEARAAGDMELASQLQNLLAEVLLFNIQADATLLAPKIQTRIQRFDAARASEPPPPVDPTSLDNALAQARTILRVKPEVDSLLSKLLYLPTSGLARELASSYDRQHAYALEQKKFSQLLLVGLVAVLLAAAAFVVIRQLEQRIEHATLHIQEQNEELKTRLSEVQAVNEVALAVSSVMDVRRVIDLILDRAKEVTRADGSTMFIIDPSSKQLRVRAASGRVSKSLESLLLEPGKGMASYVAETGETVHLSDAQEDSRFDPSFDRIQGERTTALLAVPLLGQDEVLGVVEVINKQGGGEFTESDRRLLEAMAAQASVALVNSRLYESQQEMTEDLRAALESERNLTIERDKLGAYLPKQVANEISRNREQRLALGGKMVRATILFADIRAFTKVSEDLDPQKIVGFLNEYMTEMCGIIEKHSGIIDKFIGDGIMAVFLAAESEEHALHAVRAGIEMQQRLAGLRDEWRERRPEFADIEMRIGTNTGRVVAGNIGSETRMDYTVVGDNVNVAARIEGVCTAGEVFISQSTYEDVRHSIDADAMPPVEMKNRVQPVQVYTVRPV